MPARASWDDAVTSIEGMALSQREEEVLANYARVSSMKAVADALGLTEDTVRNTASRAYVKLGAHNATDAFRLLGWLQVPA
jgi:DNA-binding NarL/FixJ family response regulator